MANVILPGEQVFLDTSYALALSASTDRFHARAIVLAENLLSARSHLITTRAVLLEIGNTLARQRYRAAAVALLQAMETDPSIEIVSVSDVLYLRALQLFCDRPDKDWGLIDCTSFVVMKERGLTMALTADEHFMQCGFHALLREEIG